MLAPVLTLPKGVDDYEVFCDASITSLRAVLKNWGMVIGYASRKLKPHEARYL